MQEITNLVKSGKDNYNVFLDGVFFCKLNAETILKEKLKVGMFVPKEKLEYAQLENEKLVAFERSLKYLASPKTKKQVSDYLFSKGYAPQTVSHCLSKLDEYGYLNDEVFARQFIESYKHKKGRRLLEFELASKGVSPEISKKVLEDLTTDEEYIINLAEKYLKNKEKNSQTAKKLFNHLFSKGFSFEEISPVVKKLVYDFGEENEGWNWPVGNWKN